MACEIWDLGCKTGQAVQDAANDAVKNLAKAIADAAGNVVKTLGTFWVNVGTPTLTSTPGGSAPSAPVAFLQGSLWFWTMALAVLSVLIGAGKMMVERRGAPMRELARSLATLVVVSGAGVAAVGLLVTAADQFSVWVIDKSTAGTSFNAKITEMLALSSASPLGSIMIILLGLIAILSSVIQIVLMIIRGGLLVILTGIFPTAAAFSNTESGRGWFQKCVAWLVAFILYKPAAAIVYATAFRLTGANVFGSGGDGEGFSSAFLATVTGLALMVIALFAMPALMRFVTPMVGAVASGGGGAMAAGAVGAVASGAVSMGAAGRGSAGASTSFSSPSKENGAAGPAGSSGTGSSGATGPGGTGGKDAPPASAGSAANGAPEGAARGTGTTGGSAAGESAAGGAAAATGPMGVGVAVAQKGLQAGQAAAGAVKSLGEESTGGA